jgi:hypothetical protein
LTLDPTLYLDEIAAYIMEKYALDVSTPTISRCLKAKGISKKVVSLHFYLYLYTDRHASCKNELSSATKSFETIGWAASRSGQLARCSFLTNLLSMSVHSSVERAGLLEVLLLTMYSHLNGLNAGASCYAMAVKGLSAMTSYMAVLRQLHITHSLWSKFYHDAIHFRAQTVSSAWITLESIAQRYVFFIYY